MRLQIPHPTSESQDTARPDLDDIGKARCNLPLFQPVMLRLITALARELPEIDEVKRLIERTIEILE